MPATEAPPAVVPAKPGPSPEQAAARAAQTTISVSALPKGDLPAAPPKRGTARARLYEQMQKKFGGEPSAPAKTPAPAEAPAPHSPAQPAESSRVSAEATGEKGAGEAPSTEPSPETTPAPAASTTTEAAGTAPETTKDGKRVSPWKLVDQFKDRAAKAEARVLELEKQVPNEAQRKANEAELADLRAKAKEMADELRYHNAEKYDPDVLQAKEAYNRAFNRAMSELKGVSVTDPATQQPRALTVDDLAELAFRPLQEAQSIAKEVFGDLAPYVMDHRNEIRRLWDEQIRRWLSGPLGPRLVRGWDRAWPAPQQGGLRWLA